LVTSSGCDRADKSSSGRLAGLSLCGGGLEKLGAITLYTLNTTNIYIYCDVDSTKLGKHPLPAVLLHAVPSRAEVSRAEPSRAEESWLLRRNKQLSAALPSNAFVNMTSRNSRTTVARQAVNTALLNNGAYYVTVFCVVRPEAK
jgi:hypothetical protein